MRGELAPQSVPRSATRGERFDDLVLDAIEELEQALATEVAAELAPLEFAVEEVPPPTREAEEFDPEVVVDRGVALGRLLRTGSAGDPAPTIVVYRRPVEARAGHGDERADLIFLVVAELVAEFLGRDLDDIDPPRA
jgi:predicted Zn-dependent protease with MMP-like domain